MALWRDLPVDSGAGEPRVFDFKGGSDQGELGPVVDRIYSASRATVDADTLLAELQTIIVSRQEAACRASDGADS